MRLLERDVSVNEHRALVKAIVDYGNVLPEDNLEQLFQTNLIEATVVVLTNRGERGLLVEVLARNCPNRVYGVRDIEFFLTCMSTDKIEDGVMVLIEAYQESNNEVAKQQILKTLRRGFRGHGIEVGDDEQFVKECKKWYLQNLGGIEPNPEYVHNNLMIGDPYAKIPLFKLRD